MVFIQLNKICISSFSGAVENQSSVADNLYQLGTEKREQQDIIKSAHEFDQRSQDIRIKLVREEHQSTADWYYKVGITQHKLGDFKAALQSKQRALEIRIKLFGEEHQSTADCYYSLGVTLYELGDLKAALQSHQRALGIRIKLFGEEHQSTADCYT